MTNKIFAGMLYGIALSTFILDICIAPSIKFFAAGLIPVIIFILGGMSMDKNFSLED